MDKIRTSPRNGLLLRITDNGFRQVQVGAARLSARVGRERRKQLGASAYQQIRTLAGPLGRATDRTRNIQFGSARISGLSD
jgi:hypothetical protein